MNQVNTNKRFISVVYILVSLLLLLLALIIPRGEDVFWINGHHTPMLDNFFSHITHLGEGSIFILLVLVVCFIRYKYVILALIVWIGHGLISLILKQVVFTNVGRPKTVLDNELLYFIPNVEVHANNSFPSGHTMTIFCLAFLTALLMKNRGGAVGLLIIALLVGYSRIYLLQHFLLDVAGGAVIGVTFTFLVWNYFERKKFPEWMNGRINKPAK